MKFKSQKDWDVLLKFEKGYDCIDVQILPYESDTPVIAKAFILYPHQYEGKDLPKRLPQERYVRVIAEGMRQAGVDEEYIDYQIMNEPYIPSRKPGNYLTFANQEDKKQKGKLNQVSWKEYKKKGKKMGWFLVGKRIIQLGKHDPNGAYVAWIMTNLCGEIDCTWVVMQTFYDPDLPECKTMEDAIQLHQEWAENILTVNFEQACLTATAVGNLEEQSCKAEKRDFLRFLKKKSIHGKGNGSRSSSTATSSSISEET
jgi:hypothetical protein